MKKIVYLLLVLLVVMALSSCDTATIITTVGETSSTLNTSSQFTESTTTVIDSTIEYTTVSNEALAQLLFSEMLEDYNDQSDGFNCENYFSSDLAGTCASQAEYFAPSKYTTFTIVDSVETDVNDSTLGYTYTTSTDIINDYIEFVVGLDYISESLLITSWEYTVINNPNLTQDQLKAYSFMYEYNDGSIDNTVFANKWINNSIDASNTAMIRRTHLGNGQTYELESIAMEGEYKIITFILLNSGGDTSSINKYVLLSNGKLSSYGWEFKITDEFNSFSYSYAYNFMNENISNTDVCSILDSGSSTCSLKRNSYITSGFDEMLSVNAYESGIVDGYITFINIFRFSLNDGSVVTITLQCQIISDKHEYTITSYEQT
ncbi:hypothetical protein RJI07_02655 [Mycoplasmatota bacterium WC30]